MKKIKKLISIGIISILAITSYTFARKTFNSCAYPVTYTAGTCVPAIDGDWYVNSADNFCTLPANYRVNGNIYLQGYTINLNGNFGLNLATFRINTQLGKLNIYSGKISATDGAKGGFCMSVNYAGGGQTPCPFGTYVLDPNYPLNRFLPNGTTFDVASSGTIYCARATAQYIDPNYN